ncbi:hypothetical protein KQX54_013912 [Cotesia glomerata]|uniref:Vesicle-fusing ATPase n=1 Tax=Cotesia glomerata TaxID=32391 RepID=A0AAV7J0A7_COTGL|nr:hypothetical protein KQX54_013912 [Cotesia glomerata]
MMKMRVEKCPTVELTFKNCVFVNPVDLPKDVKYIEVTTLPNQNYVFTVETHNEVSQGCAAFNELQRKWAALSVTQEIDVRPYQFDASSSSNFLEQQLSHTIPT